MRSKWPKVYEPHVDKDEKKITPAASGVSRYTGKTRWICLQVSACYAFFRTKMVNLQNEYNTIDQLNKITTTQLHEN